MMRLLSAYPLKQILLPFPFTKTLNSPNPFRVQITNFRIQMMSTQKKTKSPSLNEDLDNINNGDLEEEEEDRISSLPDNLLITILNFLPINFAAATSVLSHRWRYLWTHITHFYLSPFKFPLPNIGNLLKLVTIVDHILSQLNSPVIHSFEIQTGLERVVDPSIVYPSFMVPWITRICLRNPEIIVISFRPSLSELPVCLFTTQSLTVLRLSFRWKFPDDNSDEMLSINLPNLKELKLRLCGSNHTLMRTLFKSCPLLERLSLTVLIDREDHFVDIVAPNLNSLEIFLIAYTKLGSLGSYCNWNISIDAPNLDHFTTNAPLPFYNFVNKPRVLQEAILTIPNYYSNERDAYLSRIVPLFQGISCARYLIFEDTFPGLYLMGVALPIFHNLTNLTISFGVLESYSQAPRNLLINLRTLKIQDMELNDKGIKFLEDILSNATVLEQLDIFSDNDDYQDDVEYGVVLMEYKFCMKLFMLLRISSNCLINFSGFIFTTSSNAIRKGRLVCKITNCIYE